MIGKTRRKTGGEVEEISDPAVGRARGVLRRPLPAGTVKHLRMRPASDVAPWIAHYWMVSWDLRGHEPHFAETLPHPHVHLVFEKQESTVWGVQTSKFSRMLEGRSHVFGIKFRPGGFHPFFGAPVSRLADRVIPARDIFGKDIGGLERIALAPSGADAKVQAADEFFRARAPQPDEAVDLAAQLVEMILSEPTIRTVGELSSRADTGKRTLERIFNTYVGVSPKWVIRRYRLHELIERLHSGESIDWSRVALDLGYYDQAHLINDFRSIVGCSPTHYEKAAQGIRD